RIRRCTRRRRGNLSADAPGSPQIFHRNIVLSRVRRDSERSTENLLRRPTPSISGIGWRRCRRFQKCVFTLFFQRADRNGFANLNRMFFLSWFFLLWLDWDCFQNRLTVLSRRAALNLLFRSFF